MPKPETPESKERKERITKNIRLIKSLTERVTELEKSEKRIVEFSYFLASAFRAEACLQKRKHPKHNQLVKQLLSSEIF